MKRKQQAHGQACACPVLTPSITLKLTLFMVGLIGLLLALVWLAGEVFLYRELQRLCVR